MTLSDFARVVLKWSGCGLYAVTLAVLATGVWGAFEYGVGFLWSVLGPSFAAFLGGTVLVGLSSLLSEVGRLREDIASGACDDVAPPVD